MTERGIVDETRRKVCLRVLPYPRNNLLEVLGVEKQRDGMEECGAEFRPLYLLVVCVLVFNDSDEEEKFTVEVHLLKGHNVERDAQRQQ